MSRHAKHWGVAILALAVLAGALVPSRVSAALNASSKDLRTGDKVPVAVTDFTGPDPETCEAVTRTFTTALAKRSKRLELVERAQLLKVLAEQRVDNDGLCDPATAARIGKLLGARKVIVGGFSRIKDTVSLDARLVDVETGTLEDGGAEQVFGALKGEGIEIFNLAQNLANSFHFAITGQWLTEPVSVVEPPKPPVPGPSPAPAPDSLLDPLRLIDRNGSGIRLDVKLDRREGSTYRWGEKMQIQFKLDVPAHVYLFNVDTSRKVTQIYPNEWHKDQKLEPRTWYKVPGEGEEWELGIEGEMGPEEIVAIATSRPLDLGVPSAIGTVSKSASDFAGKGVVAQLRATPSVWAGRRLRFFTTKEETRQRR